jgi:hypothetical protein
MNICPGVVCKCDEPGFCPMHGRQVMSESVDVNESELESTDNIGLNKPLMVNIAERGLQQPIHVRKSTAKRKKVLDGKARLKACRHLGMKMIPVIYH